MVLALHLNVNPAVLVAKRAPSSQLVSAAGTLVPVCRVRRLPAACDADAAQNSATTSPVHASQQRAAACDLRQCWEGPCPSRARRLSPDVRRIASSGRTPSLSRGAAEPGRLKLCPTSPFRGGCATEWIADESLSAVHGA